MKNNVKLLYIIILFNFLTTELFAFRENDSSHNLNNAVIKSDISSSTYNNLPKNEVINTIYEDPLSESFMGKDSKSLDSERNRSTSDLVSEFENQAKEINDNTEIPDNIADEHTKEERERIEAKADELLKEAAIKESNDNTGKSLLDKSENKNSDVINKLQENDKTNLETTNSNNNEDENKKLSEDFEQNEIANNEIISEEDPEFLDKDMNENVEIIMVSDQEGMDEDIPDYTKLQGINTVENHKKIKSSNSNSNSKKSTKKTSNNKKKKKMFVVLDPLLMTDGDPIMLNEESNKSYTYTGILIPEKQPLSKRKSMLRWVLELEDGRRIPLKSNLKLLQEVRKQDNLEDYVSISGKMRISAYDKNLKYLVPETVVKSGKKSKNDHKESTVINKTALDSSKTKEHDNKETDVIETKESTQNIEVKEEKITNVASDTNNIEETTVATEIKDDKEIKTKDKNETSIATDTKSLNEKITLETKDNQKKETTKEVKETKRTVLKMEISKEKYEKLNKERNVFLKKEKDTNLIKITPFAANE